MGNKGVDMAEMNETKNMLFIGERKVTNDWGSIWSMLIRRWKWLIFSRWI